MMKFKPITAIVVLLLVITSLSIAGCTTSTTSTATPTATASTTGVATTGVATTANLSITVQPVKLSLREQNASQKAGFKYIAYNCTVKNVGTKERLASYNVWTLRDTQGGVYDNVLGVQNITRKLWNPTGQFLPGDIIYGVVVFEVPTNVQQFKSITYHDAYADNGIFKAGPNITVTL